LLMESFFTVYITFSKMPVLSTDCLLRVYKCHSKNPEWLEKFCYLSMH
jgi:hypothetical protein